MKFDSISKSLAKINTAEFAVRVGRCWTGADPGFQVRVGALKIIAPSGARRENFGDISCE